MVFAFTMCPGFSIAVRAPGAEGLAVGAGPLDAAIDLGGKPAQPAHATEIKALVSIRPIVLFELDRLGHYTLCNGSGLVVMGIQPEHLLGQSIFDRYAHLPEVLVAVRMALAGEGATRTIALHGRVFAVVYLPKFAETGAIVGVIGVAYDITDLHAATLELQDSERRLRASEGLFHSLITNMPGIIFSHGIEGTAEHGYDEAGPSIFGADAQRLAGTLDGEGRPRLDAWYAAVHPDDQAAYRAAERRRKEQYQGYTLEYRVRHPVSSQLRWMREVAWARYDEGLQRHCFDSYIIDITEPKLVELALKESQKRYRSLIDTAPVAILIFAGERCTYANPQAVRLLGGAEPADLEARHLWELISADQIATVRAALAGLTVGGAGMSARELACTRLDGVSVAVEASAVAVAERGVKVVQLVLVDLTERKWAESLHHVARHDALTGLPNRALLRERLQQGVANARRGTARFALMLLDLDRFKDINDGFGHTAGDELLQQVAMRVRRVIREVDTLARLGGDEFALIQVHTVDPEAMKLVAERIILTVAEPVRIEHQEIHPSISIGIASCPQDACDVDDLLRQADLALYRAKARGRGRCCFFEPSLDAAMAARRQLEADLAQAMEQGELHIVYQPQLDMATRRVVGVEALLRWDSPTRGSVAPSEFIPVAEATGLIRALGAWVLDQACAQGSAWYHDGLQLPVAVNVSAVELRRSDFAIDLVAAMRRHRVPAERLCLELAESVLTDPQLDDIGAVLDEMAATGVGIAIDNFGLGHSSLQRLRRMPVRCLKIDRTLVRTISSDPDCTAIVRASIGLGHGLGKLVLAEGVETEAQHALLASLGCDRAQGYVYARPASAASLRPYLTAHG